MSKRSSGAGASVVQAPGRPEEGPVREFRSDGARGSSAALLGRPDVVRVQKRPARVIVRFATAPETVQTREGPVHARAGDAVVSAPGGEQWPVERAAFEQRYRPAGPPGVYDSVPQPSLAVRMADPFAVVLADGVSRLSGQPGDWLIDYGDGHLGIVGADIFAATYHVLD
ncbi:PGDYG domain-containing protein [Massilia sp. SYSU DXS3249]